MSDCRAPQRLAFSAVLLLLLISFPLAASNFSPSRVSSAEFYIDDNYSVDLTAGSLTNLTVNLSIPPDAVVVSSPDGASRQTDALGNTNFLITQSHPDLPYLFNYNLSIHTSSEPLTSLPPSGTWQKNMGAYLQSTPHMPAADPAIKAMAANITSAGSTDFGKVSLLAIWVHDYITYDTSAADPNPDANTILATRRGVCTEYAVLFATLARASGYPTRFVNGYAYASNLGVWQAHAWTEVYLGKWVPVDPTWLEVGSVDATHIVISRSGDSGFEMISVSGMVSEDGRLVINGDHPPGAEADNVHLVSTGLFAPETNYDVGASSTLMPSGSRTLVWMRYTASDYRIMSVVLAPCSGAGEPLLTLRSKPEGRLITAPGKTYYLIWELQASSTLDPSYIYRCPTSVNSEYLQLKSVELSARDDLGSAWPIAGAELARSSITLGENQTVFIQMPASMAGKPIHLLEDDFLLNSTLDGTGAGQMEFTPALLGNHTIYMFSSSGDYIALNYSVIATPAPSILSATSNQSLMDGADAELVVTLANLNESSAPAPYSLDWSGNGESGREEVASSNVSTLRIPIRPSASGDFIFTYRLLASDGQELAHRSYSMTIWPKGEMDYVSLTPISRTPGGLQVALIFNKTGEVRNPQLILNSISWDIPSDGRLALVLAPGQHNATIQWRDGLGTIHLRNITLDAQAVLAQPRYASGLAAPVSNKTSLEALLDPKSNILLPAALVVLFFGLLYGGTLLSIIRELRAMGRSDEELGKGARTDGADAPDSPDKTILEDPAVPGTEVVYRVKKDMDKADTDEL